MSNVNGKPRFAIDESVVPKDPKKLCLTPSCGNMLTTGGRRGLCQKCYGAATLLVATGKAKWKKLEKAGKALPTPPRRDERRISWFLGK